VPLGRIAEEEVLEIPSLIYDSLELTIYELTLIAYD
jgi:hypothetical protein